MTAKKWFFTICIVLLLVLGTLAGLVWYLDPFFHYRGPRQGYFYTLYDQRYQNDGITRHFDYDAMITGTSMAENFKTSEFDDLFGTSSIKVCYSGATYRELNDNLKAAFETHDDIRMVLRCLDLTLLNRDPEGLRQDMGSYPDYLYNDNPFDDVKYLLSRDALVSYCMPMVVGRIRGEKGGVTSFDDYSSTEGNYDFGPGNALNGATSFTAPHRVNPLTKEDQDRITANMEQNVTELAAAHPETTFYYFFPPYSMVYWGNAWEAGDLDRELKAQELAIRMMLEVPNIKVFAFGTDLNVTADLNNYRDAGHYGAWINTKLLTYMAKDQYRITKDNVDSYLEDMQAITHDFDYNTLLNQ